MLLLHVSVPVDYLHGDRLQRNAVVMLSKVPEDDQQGPEHIEGAAQRMVDVRLLYGVSIARK
jgi:hypothetical protein